MNIEISELGIVEKMNKTLISSFKKCKKIYKHIESWIKGI